MKLIKFMLKFVMWLAIVVVVAVLALPLWIGPVAKTVANNVGPKFTKTAVRLGDFALNPYTGEFRMGELTVANPDGFSKPDAVKLGNLEVSVDPVSLAGDVIHVRLIRIKDVYASYLSENGRNNFDVLMENAGVKKDEKAKETKAAEARDEVPAEERKAEKPAKKVVIDRFEISGVMVQLGPLPLPIPPLTLTDIGKKSNGATMEEVWEQVSASVMKSAGVIGENFKALQGALGDSVNELNKHAAKVTETTKKVTEATKKFSDAAGKIANGAAIGKSTEAMTKSVGGATKSVTEATSKTVGGATKSVTETTKSVTEGATKSVEAVGEGAKKAMDSLKSLW